MKKIPWKYNTDKKEGRRLRKQHFYTVKIKEKT